VKNGARNTQEKRSPKVAALVNLFLPGSGQVYTGQLGKAIFIMFTWWLVIPWVYGIADAQKTAKRINEGAHSIRVNSGRAIGAIVVLGVSLFLVFILSLLTAIAIPNFIKARGEAKKNAAVTDKDKKDIGQIGTKRGTQY